MEKKENHSTAPVYHVSDATTLLEYLLNELHLPRNKAKSLLSHQCVHLNGHAVSRHDTPLRPNDQILLVAAPIAMNPKTSITILYEDDEFIAIDKPAGLLSIATDKEKEKTAYHQVSAYLKSRNPKARLFVLHRLDRDTSGVLVFCKNQTIRDQLQSQWNQLVSLREYMARVKGTFPKAAMHVENCLKENAQGFVYVCSDHDPKGQKAITDIERLDVKNQTSLLRIRIASGRKNQIRVTLADLGYPVLGDTKYGLKDDSSSRLALHASKLSFVHPLRHETLCFSAELPKELN